MQQNRLYGSFSALPLWGSLVLLFVLAGRPVAAQSGDAIFEAGTGKKEVPAGYRFEVTFTLRNAEGSGFRPPDFKGFRLIRPTETQRGVTMTNGRSTIHQSWSFELEAVRPGTFSIGPATVTADGKTLRTQPLPMRVGPSPTVNLPRGANEDLFVTTELVPAGQVFTGQQVKLQIKMYTRVGVEAFDMLELPKLDGFYVYEMKRFDKRTQELTLRGKPYIVRTLHEMAIFPQEAGEFTIGPARMRFEVEKPGASPTIFGPATTPMLLQTAPVRLRVLPLSEPAPEGFAGVAGQYEVKYSIDRDSLTTDDAVTLIVEIQGNGDARRFSLPQPALPEGLEIFPPKVREEEEYESMEALMHRQVLEYVILPKKPGQYDLVPSLAFFDPDSNRYVSRRPEPALTLTVAPGQNAGLSLAPPDSARTEAPPSGAGSDFWTRLADWRASPWLWLALAAPAVGWLLFLGWKKRRRAVAPPAPGVFAPPPPDARDTRERFANARRLLANDSPRLFFDELQKALRAWLAASLHLPAPTLTPELVRAQLAQRQVPESRIAALLDLWQTCEQAVFAGRYPYLNMEATWRQAEEVVRELEKNLRR